jgi:cell division protein ZipA
MDTLRLILLGIGAIIIGGMLIYYWVTSDKKPNVTRLFSFLKSPRSSEGDAASEMLSSYEYEDEPDAEDIAALSGLTQPLREPEVNIDELGPISALAEEPSVGGEQLIMVLNVMAKQGHRFHGLDILNAMRDLEFEFGDMNLFHAYVDQSNKTRPLCSIANTVEPGTFNIEHIAEMETPGLSFFMQLPGPMEDRRAFERMLQLARALAEKLGGDLCDESRNLLTLQNIGHMKDKVEAFHFKHKMNSLNNHRH